MSKPEPCAHKTRFILGHLSDIVKICDEQQFHVRDLFAIEDNMLTSSVRASIPDKEIHLANGESVTSVFPVVQLSCDVFAHAPKNWPGIGAVTDGDTSMWTNFQLHLTPGTFDPQSQFCDWHKGQNLKKAGERLLSLARAERTKLGHTIYDATYKLGNIIGGARGTNRAFNTLFGPLLHVVRRHENLAVAELFLTIFVEKASGCGLLAHPNNFKELHHFVTGASGRYGMSTFVVPGLKTLKYGCGLTANPIEGRANKHIKRALGTKLGFTAMHAIVKQSCSSQCRATCALGFSVRQACIGDCDTIYCNKEYTHYGENPTGANWKLIWEIGRTRADDTYWKTYCWENGMSWPDSQFTIPSNAAVEMCRTMQMYYNDNTKTLRDYCRILKADWTSFMKDPVMYRENLVQAVQSFNVQRARDHTLDAKAFADTTSIWKASEAQVFDVVERDVLFQQKVTRFNILRVSTFSKLKIHN